MTTDEQRQRRRDSQSKYTNDSSRTNKANAPQIRPLLSDEVLSTVEDGQAPTDSIHDSDTIRQAKVAYQREMTNIFDELF